MKYWEKHLEKVDTEEVIERFYKDPHSVNISIDGIDVYITDFGFSCAKIRTKNFSAPINKADFMYLNGLKCFAVKEYINASFETRHGFCLEEVVYFERLP